MSGEAAREDDGSRRQDGSHERDTRPPTLAVGTSLVAAAVAALAGVFAAPLGGSVVGLAAIGFVAGSFLRSARVLSWAAGTGAIGIMIAGYLGGAVEPLLVSGVGLALAWDVADHGLSVGKQVGRKARTRRNVAVHAGTNLLVGGLSVGVVYGVYIAAAEGQPVAALALLLFGGVVLASAFR